jgi:hypothetical protein
MEVPEKQKAPKAQMVDGDSKDMRESEKQSQKQPLPMEEMAAGITREVSVVFLKARGESSRIWESGAKRRKSREGEKMGRRSGSGATSRDLSVRRKGGGNDAGESSGSGEGDGEGEGKGERAGIGEEKVEKSAC